MVARGVSAPPAVIRHTPFTDDDGFDLRRIIPAWIISGVIHVVLLSFFLLITYSATAALPDMVENVGESHIEGDEAFRDKNLTNENIGNDPDLPTGYNVERLADVNVPGLSAMNDNIGVLGEPPEAPPMNVAPPPGFGGAGQGGSLDANRDGNGNPIGTPGGMAGRLLLPGGPGGRSGATRERMLKEGGGNTASEAAVALGLKWIARHQATDGHWGLHDFMAANKCTCGEPGVAGHDMAGTAFALLPLLGAGETHMAANKNNIHAKTVGKGLDWMCAHMGADGHMGDGYTQGIATIVLCEAYGLTADPRLRPFAQRAVNKIVDWQAADGGFRYSPKQAGDLSVAGWHIQALKSAQMAGLNVPNATLAGVNEFLQKVSANDGSRYGYMDGQGGNNQRLSAVGLLCRQYLGWGPRTPGLVKGVADLQRVPPGPNPKDIYYFYYATQVMHHMSSVQPEAWDKWNVPMRDMLIKAQDHGGDKDHRDQKGSWSPASDALEKPLGRLGYTSLVLLTLEVYYRHLPLYRREMCTGKDPAVKNGL
jgi:hypothetical protein